MHTSVLGEKNRWVFSIDTKFVGYLDLICWKENWLHIFKWYSNHSYGKQENHKYLGLSHIHHNFPSDDPVFFTVLSIEEEERAREKRSILWSCFTWESIGKVVWSVIIVMMSFVMLYVFSLFHCFFFCFVKSSFTHFEQRCSNC